MTDKDRLKKRIYQGENSYCHFSKCFYFNAPSQRLAFVVVEGYDRISLEKYKDCKWELDGHDVRIDGVLISCAWPEFIPSLLKDLDEILKMRKENEILKNRLQNPQPAPLAADDSTIEREQSKEV